MEPADRGSLRTLLDRARKKRLSATRALDIAIQIADALQTAHDSNIVHANLKPENVLIARGGRAMLLDTGLSQALVSSGLCKDFSQLGAEAYRSPEQSAGEPIDARSDVYSLGALLREMVDGAPAPITEIIEKALSPAPKARYATIYAMQRALYAARGAAIARKRVLAGVLAGAALLAAITGATWTWARSRPTGGLKVQVATLNTPTAQLAAISATETRAPAPQPIRTTTPPSTTQPPTATPAASNTPMPTAAPTIAPTMEPTEVPASTSTPAPAVEPSSEATALPTSSATVFASAEPAATPARRPRLASARTVRSALKVVLATSAAERWGRPDAWTRGDVNVCAYIDSVLDSGGERLWRFTAQVVLKNTSRDVMRFPANSLVVRTRNNVPVPICGTGDIEIAPSGENTVTLRGFFEGDKLTPYKFEMLPAGQSLCIVPLGNTADFSQRTLPFGAIACGR
jgi:serine/threonine protein kinase